MRVRTFLLLALVSFGAAATSTKEFLLNIEYEKAYSFVEARAKYDLRSMYGSYGGPMDLTGGDSLNIYPNGKFTVVGWCDICGSTLVARGSYTFANGIFEFSYDEKKDGSNDANSPTRLAAFHGWIEEKPGIVTASAYILIRPDQVEAARKKRYFYDFLRLKTWYPDWQAMYEKDIAPPVSSAPDDAN